MRRSHTAAGRSSALAGGKRKRKRFRDDADVFAAELRALERIDADPYLSPRDQRRELAKVIRSFVGDCPSARYWEKDLRRLIFARRLDTGEIDSGGVRRPSRVGRRVFRFLLLVIGQFRRHGRRIRASGHALFLGHSRLSAREQDADPLALALADLEREHSRDKRPYCPVSKAGGLAARVGVGPRSLTTYADACEAERILRREQPPHDSADAQMPRRGDWPYANWHAPRGLPAAILRRLRQAWGELEDVPIDFDAEIEALHELWDRLGVTPRAQGP